VPTLVVMAAGLGARYGGGKQVDGLGPSGELLLEYAVFDARLAGFRRVVFVIRPALAEPIAALAARLPRDLEVCLVEQRIDDAPSGSETTGRTKPWGTVHAVLAARHATGAAFAAINADDFYGRDAYAIAAGACARAVQSGVHALIGLRLDATLSEHGGVTRAIPRVEEGRLRDLDEVRDVRRSPGGIAGVGRDGPRRLTGAEIASMNCWVFAGGIIGELTAVFEAFLRRVEGAPDAECALPEAVSQLVRDGRASVDVLEAPGPWFGLTHRADRPKVVAGLRDLVARGAYPSPLWGSPS
jgi:hypothetical protein